LTTATAVLTSAPRSDAPDDAVLTLDLRPAIAREKKSESVAPPSPPSQRQDVPPESADEFPLGLPSNDEIAFDDEVRFAAHPDGTATRTEGLSTAIGASAVASGRHARGRRAAPGRPDGGATIAAPLAFPQSVAPLPDEPPVALESPQPEYPEIARRRGEQGVVLCRLWITDDGSVGDVEIKGSSGHELLDEAAREGLKCWKFRPGTRAGRPHSCRVDQRVTFQLR
jgi:TonB family protein